jgi:hypothetical protein
MNRFQNFAFKLTLRRYHAAEVRVRTPAGTSESETGSRVRLNPKP